ncbi:MAG: HEAT repeat domain-containing protein [Desulfobacteraceae bacterium]|jgi:HEAT repeat protein
MWLRLLILIVITGIGCSAPTSKPAPTISPAPPPAPWYVSYGFKSYEEVIQPKSVGTLVLALSDRSNKVRASAAEALGKIGPEAAEAVPALIRSLKSVDDLVRARAAEALGDIGAAAEEAVPLLVKGLEDENSYARVKSAEALGKIGREAAEAVPALIRSLADKEYLVRSRAIEALGRIEPDARRLVPALMEALRLGQSDISADVRTNAVEALANIGAEANGAVPVIVSCLGDIAPKVRSAAAHALEKIVPDKRERAVLLAGAMEDKEPRVRRTAVEALAKIGPEAEDTVSALIRALGDSDYEVRRKALEGIRKVEPPGETIAPAFLLLLDDPEPEMRKEAISGLQEMKYSGSDFLDALERIADRDPDESVKKLASEALLKVKFAKIASGKSIKPEPPKPSVPVGVAEQKAAVPRREVGQRWAVIIGISRYKDTRIPSLRYACSDARAFYNWLVSPSGGRYPPSRVKLLLDEEATGRNIKNALFNWLRNAIEEDVVTIYFAGHGSPDSPDAPDNLFFLPYDAQYDSIAVSGFPMWDIETALERFIRARKTIILADACHAAGVGETFDMARRAGRGIFVNPISEGFQKLSASSDGVCVLSASDRDQYSQESRKWGGGHGVFTYFLLQGLKGEADYNEDRSVSLGEIIPYVSEQVRRETRNAQSPIVAGKFDPSLCIGR